MMLSSLSPSAGIRRAVSSTIYCENLGMLLEAKVPEV